MKGGTSLTHEQLVRVAHRWLTGYANCLFAFTEFGGFGNGECPDALGWLPSGHTLLIECKVSRADFLADRQKAFRQKPETGLGDWRCYMAPKGLLSPDDLPPGWGLLEVSAGGRVKRRVELACTRHPTVLSHHLWNVQRAEDPMLGERHRQIFTDLLATSQPIWDQLQAERFEKNELAERSGLLTALRRLAVKGAWDILRVPMSQTVHWHSIQYEWDQDKYAWQLSAGQLYSQIPSLEQQIDNRSQTEGEACE